MKFRFLFLLCIIVAGCSNNSNPVSSTVTNSRTAAGGFGYIFNGASIDRKDYPIASSGSASLQQNFGSGIPANSMLLAINLMTEQIVIPAFHSRTIELFAAINAPIPNTFAINQFNDPSSANAAIQDDSLQFNSNGGGTLVITKFDTVNNLISGTFSFTASLSTDPSKTDNVTSGFFNDIPIYIGSFGQGTVRANIDGSNFVSENSSGKSVSGFTTRGLPQLNILAFGGDTTLLRQISITLSSPKVGDFDLGPQLSGTTAVISFATSFGQPNVSISSTTGAIGKLTITKCDLATHRISGVFHLSGTDASSGKTINITNGVIDNLQWFDL